MPSRAHNTADRMLKQLERKLSKIRKLKVQHLRLTGKLQLIQRKLAALVGGSDAPAAGKRRGRPRGGRNKMSAAGRRAIAAAAKRRWAAWRKQKGGKAQQAQG